MNHWCRCLGRIAPINIILNKLFCSEQSWLWQLLVVARDFNLFAVLKNFLQRIVIRSKLLKFLAQLLLDFDRNLISALCNDSYALVDIMGIIASIMLRVTVFTGAFDFLKSIIIVLLLLYCFYLIIYMLFLIGIIAKLVESSLRMLFLVLLALLDILLGKCAVL